MDGLGRHIAVIVGIAFISIIAGILPGPADPLSSFFFTCIIFPVALISYLAGVWLTPSLSQNHSRIKRLVTLIVAVLVIITLIAASVEMNRQYYLLKETHG